MFASVLEDNGFSFSGSDSSASLLHFQEDKILPMEQYHLNPNFSSFSHTDTFNILETILVPDVTTANYTQQLDEWVRSDYFNRFHDVPVTVDSLITHTPWDRPKGMRYEGVCIIGEVDLYGSEI